MTLTSLTRFRPHRLLLALVLLLLMAGQFTSAHGYVVRSIPEDRSTLERPPTRLQYWFSEGLEPAFSEINLRDQNGELIASGGVDEGDDTLLMLQIPPGTLEDGAYIVDLRPAFASDGHVIVESRVFFVGETVEGVEGQAATTLPDTTEIVWKSLLYSATFLLFGVFMMYAYVFVPAWGNVKHERGLLPPRVMTRLHRLAWFALVVTFIANIIALLHQSTVFFGTGLEQVISGGLWQVVRIGSRFGDVWNVRMFLVIIIAFNLLAAQYYGKRFPKTVRSFWTANVWVLAVMLGAPAVNSHAAGSVVMPWLGVVMHWLHTLAVAFWLAGVVILTLVLPVALRPYAGETRQQALLAVMRRFSFFVVSSVALVITTGIYNASNWFFTPSDVATTYGASLGVKLLMMALLLMVGAWHHIALRPAWLERLPMLRPVVRYAENFGSSMRLESLLVVGALLLASVLSATPIPEPEFAQEEVDTPNAVQQVNDMSISMAIAPGGPGVNTFDVVVERDGQPVDDVRVDLQIVSPERDLRNQWDNASLLEAGLFVTSNDAMNEEGRWLTLVDVRLPDGDDNPVNDTLYRAAFDWNISNDAAVLQERPPSLITIGAAFAVLAAFLYTLSPWLLRLYARLDLSPASILVAVAGTIISIALVVWAIWAVAEQQVAIADELNPPPMIVNTVLPDAESLARGEALYQENCIIMQSNSDFSRLLRQLRLLRDDELFSVIGEGWRDVPPCNGDFDTQETWDIVNYLRTFHVRVARN
jgi:copper transport protein